MTALSDLIARLDQNSIPEPNSGCWLWVGGAHACRYGLCYGWIRFARKTWAAHRASWLAHRGQFDLSLAVCHRCDNPLCINPDHLFLGTVGDNNSDRRAKKRDFWFKDRQTALANLAAARKIVETTRGYARGERARSRLTTSEIIEIRRLSSSGMPQRAISRLKKVSQSHIRAIVHRKKWAHVAD